MGKRASVISKLQTQPGMVADELRRPADQFIDFALGGTKLDVVRHRIRLTADRKVDPLKSEEDNIRLLCEQADAGRLK